MLRYIAILIDISMKRSIRMTIKEEPHEVSLDLYCTYLMSLNLNISIAIYVQTLGFCSGIKHPTFPCATDIPRTGDTSIPFTLLRKKISCGPTYSIIFYQRWILYYRQYCFWIHSNCWCCRYIHHRECLH